jgi:hypothetical protein
MGHASYTTTDDFTQETTEASVTVVTIFKEVEINTDGYSSDNNKITITTPWGQGGTK